MRKTLSYALLIIALLTVLIYLIIINYRELRSIGILNKQPYQWRMLSDRNWRPPAKRAPTTNDVNNIRAWMTFDYINKVFNLPPEYLKTTLAITDPQYPETTIQTEAQKEKISTNVLLEKTKSAITNYLIAHQPPLK